VVLTEHDIPKNNGHAVERRCHPPQGNNGGQKEKKVDTCHTIIID